MALGASQPPNRVTLTPRGIPSRDDSGVECAIPES
jgi:hypothetical protein